MLIVDSVLGRLETLHLCSPLLNVNGIIRLFQLLFYPLTPSEIKYYQKVITPPPATAPSSTTAIVVKQQYNNSNNTSLPYRPSPQPSIYKNAIRAASLHTLTISSMALHMNALKCIGRSLLLPNSVLKNLNLDHVRAYCETVLPTHLKPFKTK